jgi:transcriptional regulator
MKKTERNNELIDLRKQGLTLHEIGKKYGVSRQRIHFILKRDYETKINKDTSE